LCWYAQALARAHSKKRNPVPAALRRTLIIDAYRQIRTAEDEAILEHLHQPRFQSNFAHRVLFESGVDIFVVENGMAFPSN